MLPDMSIKTFIVVVLLVGGALFLLGLVPGLQWLRFAWIAAVLIVGLRLLYYLFTRR
jgi:flagellar biosynthesis component FlhA